VGRFDGLCDGHFCVSGLVTLAATVARLANMITVNMHEAKTRLSELVKAVEERNEAVVLWVDRIQVDQHRGVYEPTCMRGSATRRHS
jgi:hypothetical protein